MGIFIRNVGHGGTNDPVQKRAIGLLSDGSVMAMICDMNQTGVTGDGGDNTGVPKIHFYQSTNRTSWTLRATVNLPGVSAQNTVNTFCIDSGNNIHVVYRWNSATSGPQNWQIRYRKLTYSATGPTWTVGSEVTIATGPPSSSYKYMSLLEIDTIGDSTDCVVVSAYWYDNTAGARRSAVQNYVRRTSDNTWVAHAVESVMASDSHLGYADDLTMAGDNFTAIGGDNVGVFAYHVVRKGATGTDYGDLFRIVRVNCSTGARIAMHTVHSGIFNGAGGGFRKFWLFNTASNRFDLAGVVDSTDFKCALMRVTWNRSNNTATTVVPATISSGRGAAIWRRTNNHNWCAVACQGEGRFLFFANVGGVAGVTGGGLTGDNKANFEPGWTRWDNGYGGSAGTYESDGQFRAPTVAWLEQIFSGASRNWGRSRIDALMFHHKDSGTPQSFRMESRSLLAQLAPTSVMPAASSSVSTDRPTVSGAHKLPMYYPQLRTKMQFQLATDAGFSTGLRDILQTDAKLLVANGTSNPYNAIVRSSETVGAVDELTQGTWYVRARGADYLGNYGPWSTAQSFVISHPPASVNLYPTSGVVFLYGDAGTVTFTWRFTDPSPFDSQTAYRIVIESAEDGTVLVDTDKVTSSQQIGSVDIPSDGKDIPLRWKLILWDSDDVSGPESAYHLFYVADQPAPEIVTPEDGEELLTGIPTITWDPGIGGTKVQQRFRVLITQGANVIYNSNWQNSIDTSFGVPVGYLRNGQQYTIRLEVQDNLNLQGFAEVAVSTNWTEPAAPADDWSVYLHEYANRGFVYITWSDENIDDDFVSWNLYRRRLGESASNWEHIAAIAEGSERYAYRDYMLASGGTYEYTLTQMVDRFGDYIESSPKQIVRVTPISSHYWLINPIEPEKSIPLFSVTADPFTEEYEEEVTHILGAGRVVEYGDRLGYVGSASTQLRDRFISGQRQENFVLNPALSYMSTGGQLPDQWRYITAGDTGEVIAGKVESRNPSPTGKTPFRLRATELGTTDSDSVRLEQVVQLPAALTPGEVATLSAWIDHHPDNADKAYRLTVDWLDESSDTISTDHSDTLVPGVNEIDTYIPAGSADGLHVANTTGAWRRFYFSATVPAGAVRAVIKVRVMGNGGAEASPAQLIVSGVQFEAGAVTHYVDGDQIGGEWSGDRFLSSSIGTGYYTARRQRFALEEMKRQRISIYLRNPFGDLWRIAAGNISFDRIAGIGRTEFTNATLPYQEVIR